MLCQVSVIYLKDTFSKPLASSKDISLKVNDKFQAQSYMVRVVPKRSVYYD